MNGNTHESGLKVFASSHNGSSSQNTAGAGFMLLGGGGTNQILLEQSQTHAVRLDTLAAAKPLRAVVVDETSRLR